MSSISLHLCKEYILKFDKIYQDLKKKFKVFYDAGGSVGRRYARIYADDF